MLHYKVELGPVNFQNMGDIQMNKEVNKLDDIETIDGNGQLYLALQDISMQNFIDELNKVTAPSGPLQSVVVWYNLYRAMKWL